MPSDTPQHPGLTPRVAVDALQFGHRGTEPRAPPGQLIPGRHIMSGVHLSIPSPDLSWVQLPHRPADDPHLRAVHHRGNHRRRDHHERRLRARGVPAGTVLDVALWTVPLGIVAAHRGVLHLVRPGSQLAGGDPHRPHERRTSRHPGEHLGIVRRRRARDRDLRRADRASPRRARLLTVHRHAAAAAACRGAQSRGVLIIAPATRNTMAAAGCTSDQTKPSNPNGKTGFQATAITANTAAHTH